MNVLAMGTLSFVLIVVAVVLIAAAVVLKKRGLENARALQSKLKPPSPLLAPQLTKPKTHACYPFLRGVFVAGNLLMIVLCLVPSISFDLIGLPEGPVSAVYVLRELELINPAEQFGLWLLCILQFLTPVVFLALALAHPRRWVFLVGAIVTCCWGLMGLLTSTPEYVTYVSQAEFLGWVATIMVLSGLFAFPTPIGGGE